MSTHNICISREIRKILCGYPLLSVAMKIFYYDIRAFLACCTSNTYKEELHQDLIVL